MEPLEPTSDIFEWFKMFMGCISYLVSNEIEINTKYYTMTTDAAFIVLRTISRYNVQQYSISFFRLPLNCYYIISRMHL